MATHLHRIAQEAINNAIKHGKARRVELWLQTDLLDAPQLVVTDNGIDFVKNPADQSGGMGLQIMKYRASMIGGSLEIRTEDGKGTVVVCAFQPSL